PLLTAAGYRDADQHDADQDRQQLKSASAAWSVVVVHGKGCLMTFWYQPTGVRSNFVAEQQARAPRKKCRERVRRRVAKEIRALKIWRQPSNSARNCTGMRLRSTSAGSS